MPFSKEEYSSRLDSYQDAINSMRKGRADGQKIILDQRNNWRNGVSAICFGIAAAFFAAGPNITFSSTHRAILFWVSALLFLFVGLWITIYVKFRLDADGNELATLMMEQEYHLLKVRNLYRQALAARAEVDKSKVDSYLAKFKAKSSEEAQATLENSKKIQIADDFWTIAIILAFYLLGFAFVPLHHNGLYWYEGLGSLIIATSAIYFWYTYTKAKEVNKEYRKWRSELDSLTY